MALVDQYGFDIAISPPKNFSNAAARGDRAAPQLPLYKDDFERLIPDIDRQFIVSASRKLFQNFGPYRTPCVQKAENAIGRAWDAKFIGEDKEWGKLAVDWLVNQWYGNCDVKGRAWDFKTLLWLDSVAIDRDGDFLIYLTESANGYPLTQRISVNRIGQRQSQRTSYQSFTSYTVIEDGPYKGRRMSHGVIRDEYNRPVAYNILGDTAEADTQIPANNCIHVFDPLWHDQIRGIPAGDAAIKMIYGSLTATEREQMNQNIRSSYALIEYNETGGPDINDPTIQMGRDATSEAAATPSIESLAGGMIKYFRSNSGGKLEAVDNNTPGDMWDRFQDRVIRMHASAINWPYELYWKSGEVNSALVRNIQERARMSVEDRQDVLKQPALFMIRYAVAKAIKQGLLPKPKNAGDWWKFSFTMPRKFSIDPGRDAQQRREDFKMGLRNRTEIAAEEGRLDAEGMEDERIAEVYRRARKMKEAADANPDLKVDRREFFMFTPNDMPEESGMEMDENGNPIESQGADFEQIKMKLDAYGVGVRAGAITPNDADEEAFRQEAGLPSMTNAVRKSWSEDKGFRRPITLAPSGGVPSPFGSGPSQKQKPETEE